MSILVLFAMFFRIGMFGFGGGMAMLPLIFQSVQQFGIMSKEEFANLVALSQVTPGPMAVNAATYVGFQSEGIIGAAAATFGVALPSFIMVLLVMKVIDKFKTSTVVEGAFTGIRPATVGLIGAAVIFIAETVLFTGTQINLIPVAICLVTAFLAGKFKISPIILALSMGVLGGFICG